MMVAGIVLAGGTSTRMGRDKAMLPFGKELMVQRLARILGEAVSPVVVGAAADQELPPLPPGVLIARDERPGRGPLEGICAGLSKLAAERPDIEAAFVTSCDVPLLSADFVRAMIGRLGDAEIAVPVEGDFPHPLTAVYRVSVLPHVRALLEADQLRTASLLDRVATARVDAHEFRAVDPQLWFLKNCNRPEDYDEALKLAGLSAR
ncbi:MAG TPA: molybdenum cofactor guanylyltransferase [Pirellulaceae bacterium]|nr:molybdenum cofactor guanylyltransferase [Pirellulaceae bacterium]